MTKDPPAAEDAEYQTDPPDRLPDPDNVVAMRRTPPASAVDTPAAWPRREGSPRHSRRSDDAALAARVAARAPGAREDLCRRYYRPMLAMLTARCRGDRFLAEDLTHRTFEKLIANLERGALQDPDRLSAYCHSTAKNLLLMHQRKEEGHCTLPDTEAVEQAPDLGRLSAEAAAMNEERYRALIDALPRLNETRDREVLQRLLDGQDVGQICRAMKLTPNLLYSVKNRAIKRLARLLRDPEDD